MVFGLVLRRRILQVVKYATISSVTFGCWVFLHKNDYDLSSLGIMRLGRAVVAAGCIIVDYKWSLRDLKPNTAEYDTLRSTVHKRSAQRLLELACANGGVWIKVGQHCGSLEYLLPNEYTSTLSVLHSQAPESSFSDICKVVKEELKLDVSELFEEFDKEPIGAASLAQVHKARLTDGRIGIIHESRDTYLVLVKLVARLFPEFKLMWLAEETKKNLPMELDFCHEGRNAERVRRMFSHLDFLKVGYKLSRVRCLLTPFNVPEIYWDYTTDRVLTMEYCEGGMISDLSYFQKNSIPKDDVCRKLGQLYSEMIFVHGCVHCDPHPGNILIHRHPSHGIQLVLLDHGLYVVCKHQMLFQHRGAFFVLCCLLKNVLHTLQEDFRLHYANLWLAILRADQDAIKHWAEVMGVGNLYGLFACMVSARSWKSVTTGISKQEMTAEENDEIKAYVGSLLTQISDVLDRVPRAMILIFKTNDLLRDRIIHKF